MSHRKAKRLRRAERAEKSGLLLDYCTIPLAVLHSQLDIREFPTPHPIRVAFWQLLPPGNYAGSQARDILNRYLESIERELAEQLRGNSIAYFLHLYRRLSPGPAGGNDTPVTIAITRSSLEAAYQKYAQPVLCNRVANSDEVSAEAILRGQFVKYHAKKGVPELVPQLVLTEFGREELKQFYSLERLAYEVWKTMANLRAVGKGCGLVVTGDDFHDTRSDELDFLISRYDERQRVFLSSATGTVFDSAPGTNEGWILLPALNCARTPVSAFDGLLKHCYGFDICSVVPDSELISNFVWHPFNIRSFWLAHKPFAPSFLAEHGIRLEVLLALIATITGIAIFSWKSAPNWWRLWQRAYDGPMKLDLLRDVFKNTLSSGFSTLGVASRAEEAELDAAIRFLSLPANREDVISVGNHGPHSVFLPYEKDRIFIDYAFIEARLYWLFHNLNVPDQNFKGSALESYVRDRPSILPVKPCKAADGSSRQVDAAFAVGNVLVVVECKVKAQSFGFERGDPVAIEQRNMFVDQALRQVDDKAIWLSQHARGLNYDISRFDWILPLVVTPFVEFIRVKDANHWLDDVTPRVITPWELRAGLADGLFSRVGTHHQFAQRILMVA